MTLLKVISVRGFRLLEGGQRGDTVCGGDLPPSSPWSASTWTASSAAIFRRARGISARLCRPNPTLLPCALPAARLRKHAEGMLTHHSGMLGVHLPSKYARFLHWNSWNSAPKYAPATSPTWSRSTTPPSSSPRRRTARACHASQGKPRSYLRQFDGVAIASSHAC